MERIGRNGRLLGKRGSILDALDGPAKRRLLEISEIEEEDVAEEERDGLLEVLLESNPDLLKKILGTSKFQEVENNNAVSVQSSPVEVDGPSNQPTLNLKEDSSNDTSLEAKTTYSVDGSDVHIIEDDDATQPPENIAVDSDQDSRSSVSTSPQHLNADMVSGDNELNQETGAGFSHSELSRGMKVVNGTRKKVQAEKVSDSPSKMQSALIIGEDGEEEEEEEETQPYTIGQTLVEQTQMTAQEGLKSPGPTIPESQGSESEENMTSLSDPRVREGKGGEITRTVAESQQNSSVVVNPLSPDVHHDGSMVERDKYTSLVVLMFELYLRRVRREQARLCSRAAWGKPVQTGRHLDGCLRARGGNSEETCSTSTRGRRRPIRKLHQPDEDEGAESDLKGGQGRGEDNDLNRLNLIEDYDDDYQITGAGDKNEANGTECNLGISTGRRSARLCTAKLKQQEILDTFRREVSESDRESETDEWCPGKTKRKRNLLSTKKRGVKRARNTTNAGQTNVETTEPVADKTLNLRTSKMIPNAGTSSEAGSRKRKFANKKPNEDNISDIRDTALVKESGVTGTDRKSVLPVYKFNSSGEDEDAHPKSLKRQSNEKLHNIVTKSDENDVKDEEIIIADSDTSDDGNGINNDGDNLSEFVHTRQNSKEPRRKEEQDWLSSDSMKKRKPKEATSNLHRSSSVLQGSRGGQTSKDQSIKIKKSSSKHTLASKSNLGLEDEEEDKESRASTPEDMTNSEKGNHGSRRIAVCAPLSTRLRPADCDTADVTDKHGDPVSEGSQADTPNCSQSSLIDPNGQLYSTQISRRSAVPTAGDEPVGEQVASKRAGGRRGGQQQPVQDSTARAGFQSHQHTKVLHIPSQAQCDQEEDNRHFSTSKRKLYGGQEQTTHPSATKGKVESVAEDEEIQEETETVLEDTDRRELRMSKKRRSGSNMRQTNVQISDEELSAENLRMQEAEGSEDDVTEVTEDYASTSSGPETSRHGEDRSRDPAPLGRNEDDEAFSLNVDEQALTLCPICNKEFPLIDVEVHASTCGEEEMEVEEEEPDHNCGSCNQSVARSSMREHRRICSGESGNLGLRRRRGQQP